ncbi:virulence RhuM family protein [Patescibacteria group bacterium]|nr:virulence RhuM family protein [Patescibacteria group bacterium]
MTKLTSNLIIYQTPDSIIKLQVLLKDETVWLTQEHMRVLFDKSKATISEHIKHIFEEKELEEKSVVRKFRTTARDEKSYDTNHYNLDVIISVGYRVKSPQGTQFRQWATQRIHEYIVKGFTAELIVKRVDKTKPFLGLTNFKGDYITTKDVQIAKNYLSEDELKQLNLIVTLYLDFAELQATNGRLMKMSDWIEKLDIFLQASEKELLSNAGNSSHEDAIKKAKKEYNTYRQNEDKKYISDFDKEMKKLTKSNK